MVRGRLPGCEGRSGPTGRPLGRPEEFLRREAAERRARQRRALIQSVKEDVVGYGSSQHPTISAEVKAEALQEIERKLSALSHIDELPRRELVQIAEGIRDRLFRPVLEAQETARQRARPNKTRPASAPELTRRPVGGPRSRRRPRASRRRRPRRSERRPSSASSSAGCSSRTENSAPTQTWTRGSGGTFARGCRACSRKS